MECAADGLADVGVKIKNDDEVGLVSMQAGDKLKKKYTEKWSPLLRIMQPASQSFERQLLLLSSDIVSQVICLVHLRASTFLIQYRLRQEW